MTRDTKVTSATVVYHHEDGTWWADSVDVPGFTVVERSLAALRTAVQSALPFFLDEPDVVVLEMNADGSVVRDLHVRSGLEWSDRGFHIVTSPGTAQASVVVPHLRPRQSQHLERTR